jgi:hypothetical protein
MPIVAPAPGTASAPTPSTRKQRPRLQAHQVEELPRAPNARVLHSPRHCVGRSRCGRLWRSRNSADARSPLRCRPAPARRSVATPSPRPAVHLPTKRPRAARGWWTCRAGDADRYAASSALRSSSIIRSRCAGAPSLRTRCRPARWPRRSGTDRVPRSGPRGGLRQADQPYRASHAKWSSARLRLAVRIRGKATDQPDGLPLLGARPQRRRRA